MPRSDGALMSLLDRLSRLGRWSYHADEPSASEPAAVTALALLSHGRLKEALRPLDWLCSLQSAEGDIPATTEPNAAPWTTSWAVLGWSVALEVEPRLADQYQPCIVRAVKALLSTSGRAGNSKDGLVQHNVQLRGWSWVPQTHSWVEPTALAILALVAAGVTKSGRIDEAIELLLDRQLKCGGWNYGNSMVLDQELRPDPQPSGVATAALVTRPELSEPMHRACRYLESQIDVCWGAASFSWCWLGLAAHQRDPVAGCWEKWRALIDQPAAFQRGTYHWALLAWAASGTENPIWQLIRRNVRTDELRHGNDSHPVSDRSPLSSAHGVRGQLGGS